MVTNLLAHWPALTTPLPWINTISLSAVRALALSKMKECASSDFTSIYTNKSTTSVDDAMGLVYWNICSGQVDN